MSNNALGISEPVGLLLTLWLKLVSWHPIQALKLWWVKFWHTVVLAKKKLLHGAAVKALPPGLYVQIYRGAMSAAQRDNIGATLDSFKAQGIKGIVWHGFTMEMGPVTFAALTKLCTDRGLLSLAAFGMGSTDPVGMGTRIGKVALVPGCFAVVLDMEGAWDSGKKASAVQLGQALRAVAPNALVIDQPWPEPNWHDSFPWEETAAFVDIRAPQYYVNDWQGSDRYERVWPVFVSQWAHLDATKLAHDNLVKPEIRTIQGYHWVFHSLVNCLLTNQTMIVWAEPFPDDLWFLGVQTVAKLAALGFTGPNAVKSFQDKWNTDHPTDLIGNDNTCGRETAKRLGVILPDVSAVPGAH